jgi:hypothetical protein
MYVSQKHSFVLQVDVRGGLIPKRQTIWVCDSLSSA